MPEWLSSTLFPLLHWLHIIGTTLLLGGALFYDFVLPRTLEDLRDEHRLTLYGRIRWVFRGVFLFGAVALLVSGVGMTWRLWGDYQSPFTQVHPADGGWQRTFANSKTWWALHVGLGVIGMAVALRLTLFGRVPPRTRVWMQVNIILLLVVVFLSSVTRHVRQTLHELTTSPAAAPRVSRPAPLSPAPAPAMPPAPAVPPATQPEPSDD